MSGNQPPGGMTRVQARRLELSIIGLCVLSVIMIFQPFSMTAFSIGAGLVVLGGLAFNLVPLCRAGVPLKSVLRAGLIVLAILIVVVALAMGAVELYAVYLRAGG